MIGRTCGLSFVYQGAPKWHSVFVVAAGSGQMEVGDESGELEMGTVFCVWKDQALCYSNALGSPLDLYWMRIRGEGAVDFLSDIGFEPPTLLRQPESPMKVIRQISRIYHYWHRAERRDPYRGLQLLNGFAVQCRADALPQRPEKNVVQRAMEGIESFGPDLNVAGLAEFVGVSRPTLLHRFRDELNTSPIDYLRRHRLEEAKRLLG